jgi:hypothetical protein
MININDVQKIENTRKQIKKEIYSKIFEQFSRKIKQTAEFGQKQVFLRVPSVVMGYPSFDRSVAARYLKRQLDNGGFITQLVSEIDIYVTWDVKATRESKKEEEDSDVEFPSFVNLRKVANQYRE